MTEEKNIEENITVTENILEAYVVLQMSTKPGT